jgi:nucleoside-triphosphatase THEP1
MILESLAVSGYHFVIVDEVGLLELQDGGWAEGITALLNGSSVCLLLTVRDIYVEQVIRKWQLDGAEIINISEANREVAYNSVMNCFSPETK